MEIEASTGRTEKIKRRAAGREKGIQVPRQFPPPGTGPVGTRVYERGRSVIANPDGSIVFQFDDAEIPAGWSQLATDVVVSKYFRKAGVPGTGRETSVRQLVHRVA